MVKEESDFPPAEQLGSKEDDGGAAYRIRPGGFEGFGVREETPLKIGLPLAETGVWVGLEPFYRTHRVPLHLCFSIFSLSVSSCRSLFSPVFVMGFDSNCI